jgi:hypothetical protein
VRVDEAQRVLRRGDELLGERTRRRDVMIIS